MAGKAETDSIAFSDQMLDVTGWPIIAGEPRGVRPKWWILGPDGARWLRKEPRDSRPYEPAIELATLTLARLAGFPTPDAALARWTTDDGIQHRGLVVRTFLKTGQTLEHGAAVLQEYDRGYNPECKVEHSLARVRESLESYEEKIGRGALCQPFVSLLVFDAWIGNGDRHPANWGLVVAKGALPILSPIYDTAACLGAELTDGKLLLTAAGRTEATLRRYIERCPSGFGDGRHLISNKQVLREALTWPESRIVVPSLLETFEVIEQSATTQIFQAYMPDELPLTRQELACALLNERLLWLRQEVANAH